MAKIGEGTLKKWVDGADVDAVDINKNFEVLRVANNDTDSVAVAATSSLDTKVGAVQADLNAKYTELVAADEILETSLTQTSAVLQQNIVDGDTLLRTEYQAADADLQTQVNARATLQETDARISAAISTVVAGNAVIPTGTVLPPVGEGRIDGEEFILIGANDSRTLYFYNIAQGLWLSATFFIPLPSATSRGKGIVQLADNATGTSTSLVPTQKAVSDHVNNGDLHVSPIDKANWNAKQPPLGSVPNIELNLSGANGTSPAYIDFHTTAGSDYDGRILVGTGNQRMEIVASQDVVITSQGQSFSLVDLKSSVSSGKAQVAAAITDKGISTAADATFSTMATNINNISTDPKVLTGNFNSGIQTLNIGDSRSFTIPGLPKTPKAFSVLIGDTNYLTTSGNVNPYTIISSPSFVNFTGPMGLNVGTAPFALQIALNGTQFTVSAINQTGTVSWIRFSLGSFTAIY